MSPHRQIRTSSASENDQNTSPLTGFTSWELQRIKQEPSDHLFLTLWFYQWGHEAKRSEGMYSKTNLSSTALTFLTLTGPQELHCSGSICPYPAGKAPQQVSCPTATQATPHLGSSTFLQAGEIIQTSKSHPTPPWEPGIIPSCCHYTVCHPQPLLAHSTPECSLHVAQHGLCYPPHRGGECM